MGKRTVYTKENLGLGFGRAWSKADSPNQSIKMRSTQIIRPRQSFSHVSKYHWSSSRGSRPSIQREKRRETKPSFQIYVRPLKYLSREDSIFSKSDLHGSLRRGRVRFSSQFLFTAFLSFHLSGFVSIVTGSVAPFSWVLNFCRFIRVWLLFPLSCFLDFFYWYVVL